MGRDKSALHWFGIKAGAGNPSASGPAPEYTITGNITGQDAGNLADVTVTLSGDDDDSTVTDASGDYSFTVEDGTYTITPTKAWYASFDPVDSEEVVSGGNETADFAGTIYPVVDNFEGDTIGDNEATLNAKDTHYDVFSTGVTCRAIDYGDLPAIVGPSYTQCISAHATCGYQMMVSAGEGFTPSDDQTFLAEVVLFGKGTGNKIELYMRDADHSDGILFGYDGANVFLDTLHSGGTRKLNAADGLSSSPLGECWVYLGVKYNFADNAVHFRFIEFGASGPHQEDTGWLSAGTVSEPTFDNSEWVSFVCLAGGAAATDQGCAQMRIADQIVNGYGLGVLESHNYKVP